MMEPSGDKAAGVYSEASERDHAGQPLLLKYGLLSAWMISLMGTAVSLFFSEVMHFEPCNLCWYQRIFLYPLVIVLGVAVYEDNRRIVPYVLPLTVGGTLVAFYQVLEQHIPAVAGLAPCKVGIPCSHIYVQWLGFITIPLLSGLAFLALSALLWSIRVKKTQR